MKDSKILTKSNRALIEKFANSKEVRRWTSFYLNQLENNLYTYGDRQSKVSLSLIERNAVDDIHFFAMAHVAKLAELRAQAIENGFAQHNPKTGDWEWIK